MRRLTLCLALALLLAPATAHAAGVVAFYYPWYGTPVLDGGFEHWQQNDHVPPISIASNYWPARGLYSSSNHTVLGSQMAEIRQAGIGGIAVSWWGRGSAEDARLPAVIVAARAHGIAVSVHLEPYTGRTVGSTEADIDYLRTLGVRSFYLYEPFSVPATDWAPLNDALAAQGVQVFAQTGLAGQAAAGHFAGLYTYDIVTYGANSLPRICAEAHAAHLLCEPSVGPGYDARQASGDPRVKPRRDGATYDAMWASAIAAGADAVTITSYNEWHEGTQIEPAAPRVGLDSYDGAWGLRGKRAEDAYLDRTTYWTGLFEHGPIHRGPLL
jgi:glycoprotein endo-alpha-1,2-mannosidase